MSRSSLNPPMSPSERPCLLLCASSGRDLRFDRLLLIPAPPMACDPFNREEPVTYGYDVDAAEAHRWFFRMADVTANTSACIRCKGCGLTGRTHRRVGERTASSAPGV